MTKTMPMVDARKRLTNLPEELFHGDTIDIAQVTRRGKPVLAVMPWELYESISETLDVLGDGELTAQLRQSLRELKNDETIPWDVARRELLG
ncbi:MAG TPA: type II toxin-antitoxin system Phd/YefM family antitoxin [Desulfuromonas sp.]|nr:type II toxin-antitoxin system Phd/YefM family antitoxin [Desulfuromonas sp.]